MSWQGAWTVHGRLDGHDVDLTWDRGRLSGSDAAVRAVESVLDSRDRVRLSPQDEWRDADPADAYAAMAAVQEAVEIVSVEGDAPIPEPDESAS